MKRDILDHSLVDRRAVDRTLLAKRLAYDIWGVEDTQHGHESEFYLEYFDVRINVLDMGQVMPKTHRDVVSMLAFVRTRRRKTLDDMRRDLLSEKPMPSWFESPSDEAVLYALRFVASLWLFVDSENWQPRETLADFLQRSTSQLSSNTSTHRPDQTITFNARALCRMAGMELVWTSDLKEHLRLVDAGGGCWQLFLFRHASCLAKCSVAGTEEIYPKTFRLETARTIAVLFPFAETSQHRWNRRIRRKADLDVERGVSCNTPYDIGQYHFWRERLELIQRTFETSKPITLSQWYYDRRDSEKYYTFWLAVTAISLTLLFGLIQSVTGIIQAIKQ